MFLKLIFWALKYGPSAIALIQKIIELWHTLPKSGRLDMETQINGALASGDNAVILRTVEAIGSVASGSKTSGYERK